MAETAEIPNLERITFFTGQPLTAADLAALQRANRELRWLHNRSLHGWGIGIGFGVKGERGDREVTIQPGYGVDCRGREIILTAPRTKAVPAVAGSRISMTGEAVYYLVAAYQADEAQTVVERRPGVCLPEGTVRLSEEPLLAWRQPDELQEGLELILAQAWVQNCRLSRTLSLAPRRNARPSQQPYIAAGQTEAENTAWEAWQTGGQTVGVQTKVDTSAARFHITPGYTAHVVGDRYLGDSPGPLLAVGFSAVVDPTPQGFTLQVLLPEFQGQSIVNPTQLRNPNQGPGIVRDQLGWHVVWMGVEG